MVTWKYSILSITAKKLYYHDNFPLFHLLQALKFVPPGLK